MRELKRIILHCTATPQNAHIDVATIRKWHIKRGFSDCGYHYIIHQNGDIKTGRPVIKQGAHTRSENENSIGVAYIGGLNSITHKAEDTMTIRQETSFLRLVDSLRLVFGELTIHGHNEFSTKTCPNFNVQDKFSFLKLEKHGAINK